MSLMLDKRALKCVAFFLMKRKLHFSINVMKTIIILIATCIIDLTQYTEIECFFLLPILLLQLFY